MKKIIVIGMVLLTAKGVWAQPNIEIKQGLDLKAPVGMVLTDLIGQDENSFYVRRGEKATDFFVDKFDKKTLTAKKSVELKLTMPGDQFYENLNNVEYDLYHEQVVVVFDVVNLDKRKKTLYAVKIDKNGALSKARNDIGSIDCKSGGAASRTIYTCKFSPDKSKFAVMISGDRKVLPDQNITLYDFETQKALSTKALPEDNVGDVITNYYFDRLENNGDMGVRFVTGSEKTKNLKMYTATLKDSGSGLDDVSDEGTFQDDTKIRALASELKTKDKMVNAGMYYEKTTKEYNHKHPPAFPEGVYIGITDPATHKMTAENYTLLSDDATKKLTYTVKEGDEEMPNPSDKHLVSKKLLKMNDNYYFIAENQYTIVADEKGPNGAPISKIVSINRELIISQFDKEGVFKWQKIIPKYTYDAGDFDMIKKDGKLYFIYLEDPKNATFDMDNYSSPDEYAVAKEFGSNIVCTTIDETGALSKTVIGQNKLKQFCYVPKNLNVFQDELKTTMIVSFTNGLKARFATLVIK